MHIDEDAIRRRAYRIWEAEGRPPGSYDAHWQRAREEIEREFRRATEHAGELNHRLDPPLHVEEAMDPTHRTWTGHGRRNGESGGRGTS